MKLFILFVSIVFLNSCQELSERNVEVSTLSTFGDSLYRKDTLQLKKIEQNSRILYLYLNKQDTTTDSYFRELENDSVIYAYGTKPRYDLTDPPSIPRNHPMKLVDSREFVINKVNYNVYKYAFNIKYSIDEERYVFVNDYLGAILINGVFNRRYFNVNNESKILHDLILADKTFLKWDELIDFSE